MAKKILDIDIENSSKRFQATMGKWNLELNSTVSELLSDNKNKLILNKKDEKIQTNKEILESKRQKDILVLMRQKKILQISLYIILIVLIFAFLYIYLQSVKTIKQEKVTANINENSQYGTIYGDDNLNKSLFYLTDNRSLPLSIQELIKTENKSCVPIIICRYIGYIKGYDLSTIFNQDLLIWKKIINCYDNTNCLSNFSYTQPSDEYPIKQKIIIVKDRDNNLNIYDINNTLIAKVSRDIEKLHIEFQIV